MEEIKGLVTYIRHNARNTATKLRLGVKAWIYVPHILDNILGCYISAHGNWKSSYFFAKEINILKVPEEEKIISRIEKSKNLHHIFKSETGKKILTHLHIIGKNELIKHLISLPVTKAAEYIRNPFELYLKKKTDYFTAEVLSRYQPLITTKDMIYPACLHILEEEYLSKNEKIEIEHLREKVSNKLQIEVSIQDIENAVREGKTKNYITLKEGVAYLTWVYWCMNHAIRILKNNPPVYTTEEIENPIMSELLSHKWSALIGKAGTGKTTIIKKIREYYPNAIYAATTGKAAKQISGDAHTIHMLLGYGRKGFSVKKIECPLLVVDEASMLDWSTLYAIVRAVPRAIFVGDPEQLPPVRGESVFNKIIKIIPTVELGKVYRFSGENNPDVERIKNRDVIKTATVLASYLHKKNKTFQIITPLLSTACRINKEIKSIINPTNEDIDIGDKVIVKKNVYADGILIAANGQVGKVVKKDGKYLRVKTGEGEVNLLRGEVELAYALTVHKSQGSEYDYVIFAIPPGVRDDFLTEELKRVGETRGVIKTYVIEGG